MRSHKNVALSVCGGVAAGARWRGGRGSVGAGGGAENRPHDEERSGSRVLGRPVLRRPTLYRVLSPGARRMEAIASLIATARLFRPTPGTAEGSGACAARSTARMVTTAERRGEDRELEGDTVQSLFVLSRRLKCTHKNITKTFYQHLLPRVRYSTRPGTVPGTAVDSSTTVVLPLPQQPYNVFHSVQLDRVYISLETLARSSAPHAPPTTLRAFFDSPG